jgi:hypothetical protein
MPRATRVYARANQQNYGETNLANRHDLMVTVFVDLAMAAATVAVILLIVACMVAP